MNFSRSIAKRSGAWLGVSVGGTNADQDKYGSLRLASKKGYDYRILNIVGAASSCDQTFRARFQSIHVGLDLPASNLRGA